MHICHVITRLIIGGAQENTVLTCKGLVERGHRVILLAGPETGPEGSLWEAVRQSGANVVAVSSMRRAVRPWHDIAAYQELAQWFRKLQPDLVHTHSSKAGILGRAAAFRAGVPVIVHTIHGMSFNRTQPSLVRKSYQILERRAARVTDKIVTVADAMMEQAVFARLAPREKFRTIRSGLDVNLFGPNTETRHAVRASWGVREDEVVVGTVARLFENKGYEDILAAMPRAVERNPKLRFVWVGDGPHRETYRRQLERLGLQRCVTMTGLVGPGEVARLMTGFDVLVHASRWEGLPRAVVQALLTEVPCISFDNDGAPEVVLPEETGLLVPLGDTAGLADAIVRLADDPAVRRRMGATGRRRCVDEFDWHKMVEKLEELYINLLSKS